MNRRARIDPSLGLRVVERRALTYAAPALATDDRPEHVRAASGLAIYAGRLVVIQDDASFLGVVGADGVSAVKLPRGLDGRRRFEVTLGNKHDKLDLEACLAIGDELWAFGSGSLPIRDKVCRIQYSAIRVLDATPLYARIRDAVGGGLNIEGVACDGTELWLFHRGNTSERDQPAVVRFELAAFRAWLEATAGLPAITRVDIYDLGTIEGARLGFTDALAVGDRVLYLATAERAPNAVDDGAIVGSQLGVLTDDDVRAVPLLVDGKPVKAEGLVLDPARANHAWIALDPDDPAEPSTLLGVELTGPWLG